MHRRPLLIRGAASVAATIPLLTLAGCGSDPVAPGPDASAPACAELMSRLPSSVFGRARTALNVTGAAAWGKPSIVLRCGVRPLGPTADECFSVNGLDWVITSTQDVVNSSKGPVVYVTYGRKPAVEVTVPASIGHANASAALVDLATAVRPMTITQPCIP